MIGGIQALLLIIGLIVFLYTTTPIRDSTQELYKEYKNKSKYSKDQFIYTRACNIKKIRKNKNFN